MKRILFAFSFALLQICAFGQTPYTAPWGFNYAAPTGAPSALGTHLRLDITAGRVYQWSPDALNWQLQGRTIDQISGTSAPAYAPVRGQSTFVVNGDSPPKIYQYSGAGTTWVCLNCASGGATYTAGTGIAISGSNVISNTAPDQTVTITGATGTYPNFTLPDASASNELNTGFDISAGNLRITDAGATRTVALTSIAPVQSISSGTGITISGTSAITVTNSAPDQTVVITGATGTYPTFSLPDASATNELQNLSLTGQALNISSGTGVTLPIVDVVAGTGITVSKTAGAATITNSAPDQTVSIAGGGINTVTGSYPSFTVTGNEVDGSITNEIQTIDTFSIVGQTLSISLSSDNVSVRQVTLPASGITALTGDVTATGPGSVAATIAAGAVTNTKLGTGSVDSVKVAALSISNVHIKTLAPSKILQDGATAGQVLAWNGTSNIWAPATVSGGSGWGLTGNAATAGSSFLGTTNNTSLRFRTNNVQRMIVDSIGRVGIGVAPTTTKFHVLGNANASATYTAEFHNNTGTNNALRIRDDGRVIASVGYFTGAATSLAGLLPNSANTNKGVILRGDLLTSDTGDDIVLENGQGNAANTSGLRNLLFTSRGFAPTSGTGEFRALTLAPVINQTGAANGASIGFLAVPTLTSAVSWRSFEYRNNSGFGIYGIGTAPNYINGNIGIRTTSATDNVDINGSNGYTQLRLRSTYTPTSSADTLGADGEIAIDANYIYVKVGSSWKRAALTTF